MVGNLRNQAAHITDLVFKHRENSSWKKEAEDSIRTVQTAGNSLEERVRQMGEDSTKVRVEQAAKVTTLYNQHHEMDQEITQLQKDILD